MRAAVALILAALMGGCFGGDDADGNPAPAAPASSSTATNSTLVAPVVNATAPPSTIAQDIPRLYLYDCDALLIVLPVRVADYSQYEPPGYTLRSGNGGIVTTQHFFMKCQSSTDNETYNADASLAMMLMGLDSEDPNDLSANYTVAVLLATDEASGSVLPKWNRTAAIAGIDLAGDTLSAVIGNGTFSADKLGDTPVGTAGPQAITHLVLDANGADTLRLRMDFSPVNANMAWKCANAGLPYSSQPVPIAGCSGALASRYTGFVSLERALAPGSKG